MLKEIFTTHGRLNRLPYIKYSVILTLASFFVGFAISFIAVLLTGDSSGIFASLLSFVVALPLTVGSVMVGIRRLHDLNRSGWFMLINLVPILNFVLIIYMLFFKGTEGYNDYGADPLQF